MNNDPVRQRAVSDITNLRSVAKAWELVDRSMAAIIIDKALEMWTRAGGDPREEQFTDVMGRLALHAMAQRQVDLAHGIVEAGYTPVRNAWMALHGPNRVMVGGLAHCLAGMDAKARIRTNLPDRAQVLNAALQRRDLWGSVLDVNELHHGMDALVATENSHWRDLRERRGGNNADLHDERVRFEQALVDAGCQVAREDTHQNLLAAAIPEFAAPPDDTRQGLEHVRRVVEQWGGAGSVMARAGAWTAAIRRDVRQVLVDPSQVGPRVALLDELGVALEAPVQSHVHAGVALAALQKAYLPVIDRLVASGKGFDWVDQADGSSILAKIGGGKQEVAEAVARVPSGWLGPSSDSRVNAISVQAANCNVALVERAIADGWPLAKSMGQRKTPLKTMAGRSPNSSQSADAMRATLHCLLRECQAQDLQTDVEVDGSMLKLAVGLRDLDSLQMLWDWAVDTGASPCVEALILDCCRSQAGMQSVELDRGAKALEVFEFLWARKKDEPDTQLIGKLLGECLGARNRHVFDRLWPMVDEISGSAWPAMPHHEDRDRVADLGHMVHAMITKGADARAPNEWRGYRTMVDGVLAVGSSLQMAEQTPRAPEVKRPGVRF